MKKLAVKSEPAPDRTTNPAGSFLVRSCGSGCSDAADCIPSVLFVLAVPVPLCESRSHKQYYIGLQRECQAHFTDLLNFFHTRYIISIRRE